ncbi:hypothetical protein Peur_023909 [Populus x canadensis]
MILDHGPQGAGACRGDVERDYIYLQIECGVVETIEFMSLQMLITAVSTELYALLLGNVATDSVSTNRSPFNCGRCRKRCPYKVRCVYGMCGYVVPFPPWKLPDPPIPHSPFPFPHRPPKPWPPHHPGEDQTPSTSEDLN